LQPVKGKQQHSKKLGKDAAAKAASATLANKQPKAPSKFQEALEKLDGGWTQVFPPPYQLQKSGLSLSAAAPMWLSYSNGF
jgi:hypothetical protein